MLMSFSVSNYRSFGEEQTLNMLASNRLTGFEDHLVPIDGTDHKLVRTALLYGANAAGKSNLVQAMAFAQRLISWPGILERDLSRGPLRIDRFRFDTQFREQPSSFEFRFRTDGRTFIYGFDATSKGVRSEWLSYLKAHEERLIFERGIDGKVGIGEDSHLEDLGDPILFSNLRGLVEFPLFPEQLLLNRALTVPLRSLGRTFRVVLRWLTDELEIVEPEYRSCDLLERLYDDPKLLEFCSRLLDRVGTGIRSLRFEPSIRRDGQGAMAFGLPRCRGVESRSLWLRQ